MSSIKPRHVLSTHEKNFFNKFFGKIAGEGFFRVRDRKILLALHHAKLSSAPQLDER
jgi:hypothetical protein